MPRVSIEFSDFMFASLTEAAEKQGVKVEELVKHAAVYYLGDLDSGRVAARVFRESESEDPPEDPTEPNQRRFRPSSD